MLKNFKIKFHWFKKNFFNVFENILEKLAKTLRLLPRNFQKIFLILRKFSSFSPISSFEDYPNLSIELPRIFCSYYQSLGLSFPPPTHPKLCSEVAFACPLVNLISFVIGNSRISSEFYFLYERFQWQTVFPNTNRNGHVPNSWRKTGRLYYIIVSEETSLKKCWKLEQRNFPRAAFSRGSIGLAMNASTLSEGPHNQNFFLITWKNLLF